MPAGAAQRSTQEIFIGQLLAEVQVGLAKAQRELAEAKIPPLESVTLNLIAEAKRAAEGKINLFIVSFGKKWERTLSQEIEVTLKPPRPDAVASFIPTPSLSDQLVTAIVSAGRAVQGAANKEVPLVASNLRVVLSFVVASSTKVGFIFEILPITVDLSGDLANSAIHKITVVYQNPG